MQKNIFYKNKSFFLILEILAFLAFSNISAFSQTLVKVESKPGNHILSGIWQGTDRLILFEDKKTDSESDRTDVSENPEFDFSVVLRVFYGWYDDRAAEIPEFSEIRTRDKNDAEARPPENISIHCRTIFENPSKNAGVYELELIYPAAVYSTGKVARNESLFVPIAVIDGKIYLDFLVNPNLESYDEEINSNGSIQSVKKFRVVKNENNAGFWGCASNADGITISPPRFKKEVTSYYIVKSEKTDESGKTEIADEIYKLRYWKSGMDYSDAVATFSDGKKVFEVSKFLKIGSELYQCTTGRSSKIRNIEKLDSLPVDAIFDSDNVICAFGKPYLIRIPNGNDRNDLLKIVAENNKRRKDPPKPLFPVKEIDFHWKEIDELNKYNPFYWNRRNIDLGK